MCFHPPEKPASEANRPRRFGSDPHLWTWASSYAVGHFTGNFAGYDTTGYFTGHDTAGNFAGHFAGSNTAGYFAGRPSQFHSSRPAEGGEKRRW